MREITNTVNRVALQHPEVRGIVVGTEPISVNAYAYATDGKIMFNDAYASNPRLIAEMMAYDVRAKFHPPLGHCTPAEFLAYHEAAHIIDRAHNRIAHISLRLSYGDGNSLRAELSGYSFGPTGLAPAEALAEAFAAVNCNGGNRSERALHDLLVGD